MSIKNLTTDLRKPDLNINVGQIKSSLVFQDSDIYNIDYGVTTSLVVQTASGRVSAINIPPIAGGAFANIFVTYAEYTDANAFVQVTGGMSSIEGHKLTLQAYNFSTNEFIVVFYNPTASIAAPLSLTFNYNIVVNPT